MDDAQKRFMAMYMWNVKFDYSYVDSPDGRTLPVQLTAHRFSELCSDRSVRNPTIFLKPLSKISKYDFMQYNVIATNAAAKNFEPFAPEAGALTVKFFNYEPKPVWGGEVTLAKIVDAADFLRSQGYLLSWMGLTPEKIIEKGWVTLI